MNALKEYVDGLFRHQRPTPEIIDLKEEILSNMIAKMDDLTAQGYDEKTAAEMAKDSLPSIERLIEGNQPTNIGKYRLDCSQTVLLHCILFWIFSLPMLFTHYAFFSRLGFLLTVGSGVLCLIQSRRLSDGVAFLSVPASRRRRRIAWIVWGLFFAVCVGSTAALTFAGDLWFGRPLKIDGPYQLANLAAGIYVPFLTILVPVTFSAFTKLLIKHRRGAEDE